tara:strand:- start:4276 stop:4449 length:174 start_codon:yes stop_codon:yes gene_type:complete
MPGSWDGKSRPSNDKYRNNFDDIWKKEKELTDLSYKQSLANKKEREELAKKKKEKNV